MMPWFYNKALVERQYVPMVEGHGLKYKPHVWLAIPIIPKEPLGPHVLACLDRRGDQRCPVRWAGNDSWIG